MHSNCRSSSRSGQPPECEKPDDGSAPINSTPPSCMPCTADRSSAGAASDVHRRGVLDGRVIAVVLIRLESSPSVLA